MNDEQITAALAARSSLPTVYTVICEFKISYQRALRCLLNAIDRQGKIYTLEDF